MIVAPKKAVNAVIKTLRFTIKKKIEIQITGKREWYSQMNSGIKGMPLSIVVKKLYSL